MPSEARLEIFFEKIQKKGPKIHCWALKLYTGPPNCITGASKSGGRGGPGPPGPPPGSASGGTSSAGRQWDRTSDRARRCPSLPWKELGPATGVPLLSPGPEKDMGPEARGYPHHQWTNWKHYLPVVRDNNCMSIFRLGNSCATQVLFYCYLRYISEKINYFTQQDKNSCVWELRCRSFHLNK